MVSLACWNQVDFVDMIVGTQCASAGEFYVGYTTVETTVMARYTNGARQEDSLACAI